VTINSIYWRILIIYVADLSDICISFLIIVLSLSRCIYIQLIISLGIQEVLSSVFYDACMISWSSQTMSYHMVILHAIHAATRLCPTSFPAYSVMICITARALMSRSYYLASRQICADPPVTPLVCITASVAANLFFFFFVYIRSFAHFYVYILSIFFS